MRIPALLFICFLFPPSAALADAYDVSPFNFRSASMSGADAASSTGVFALDLNPAALAELNGEEFYAALRSTRPDLWTVDRSSGGRTSAGARVDALEIGVAVGDVFGIDSLGWAMTIYIPRTGVIDTVVHKLLCEPYFVMYEDGLNSISVEAALAYQAGPVALAIGGSVLANLETNTWIYVPPEWKKMIETSGKDEKEEQELAGTLAEDTVVEVDRKIPGSFTPKLGVFFRPSDKVAFSISYRGENSIKTSGPADIKFGFINKYTTAFPEGAPTINYNNFFTPERLVFGGSTTHGRLNANLSIAFMRWSRFSDTQSRKPDVAFRDTVVPAVAVEWDVGGGFLARGGYSYVMSPAPEQTGVANFIDNDRHVYSLGLGKVFDSIPRQGDETEAGFYIQWQKLDGRDTKKDNPAVCEGADDVYISDFKSGGMLISAGAGVKVGF